MFAERDGALDTNQRAALASHLAACPSCRRTRDHFAAAIESWRTATITVAAPDADREWHSLRRRIRGGVDVNAAERHAARRPNFLPWLALPLGAAAALAVALWTPDQAPANARRLPARTIAQQHVPAVEVSAGNGSVVFVDDKSGWVVVWDGQAKQI